MDLNFDKDKKEEIKDEPKNINALFEDPNSEKINDMKKKQEMKRNSDFQSLTIALDNQNQMDKINEGNFDFSSISNTNNSNNNNNNDKVQDENQPKEKNEQNQNLNFNFDNFMNMPK